MANDPFFNESREQSEIKTAIVSKYFVAWARVIIPTTKGRDNRIAYIDLFAGPGRYEDGTSSTPLLIVQQAIQNDDLRNMLVTHFNDVDADHSKSLEKALAALPGIETLRHQPTVDNEAVGEEIVKQFEEMNLIPTFFFVDPWGYKGLSLRLVNSVLKDWGCDCVFFFNYNRINMGLSNSKVKKHMDALFGKERGARVRAKLEAATPADRELIIVDELVSALKELGGKYVLPFRFKNDKGTRTSHHLIFVSKHVRGYSIMKSIMAKESSRTDQGVASFEYNPADERYPALFALTRPLDGLENTLLEVFAGETLTVGDVFERHQVDTPFIMPNYKEALKGLEKKGKITAAPPAVERRANTMADHVVVTFPRRR